MLPPWGREESDATEHHQCVSPAPGGAAQGVRRGQPSSAHQSTRGQRLPDSRWTLEAVWFSLSKGSQTAGLSLRDRPCFQTEVLH